MALILILVVALVAWALHLMQEAIQCREFSLMLAGFLVTSSAAALMAVYFLMGHYVGYMTEMADRPYLFDAAQFDQSYFDASLEQALSSPMEWTAFGNMSFDSTSLLETDQ